MKTSIFCKSYRGDFEWLKYALKSINKYAKGFDEVVIVVPLGDMKELLSWGLTRERVIGVDEYDIKDHYLFQQDVKIHADKYCSGEVCLFMDSDCVFTKPCSIEDFYKDGKPVMMITPYSDLPADVPWQPITEKALKMDCPFETMRRMPCIYPAHILESFRAYMETIHGMNVTKYIMSQPWKAFSEFNALGSYCLQYKPNEFYFWDTSKEKELPETFMHQAWSWGGINPDMKKGLEEVTA